MQAIGVKVEKFMKRNDVIYTDENIQAAIIEDFLPSPAELALKEDVQKVTLALSAKSIDFFKKEAQKHDIGYQVMIRRLLDFYVASVSDTYK